jgi:hypothetical protein
MNRTELINFLLQQRNATRYLEIGVHEQQEHFANVRCAHKMYVDPHVQSGSVACFAERREKFDLVFIDGFHTEEQASTDIATAYQCLADGGVIVLHDCMPPDAWHQRAPEAFREGENWNGTVWKAALREFNRTEYKCTLLDTDWGCGVIDTAQSQLPQRRELPAELNYEQHYVWLLVYKRSVAAYLREQVHVFYHLACIGNWQQVFLEQTEQLQRNGFQQIDLTMLGTQANAQTAAAICAGSHISGQIIFHAAERTYFERPAMLAIEAYAQHHAGYVLYLHSKGVSNAADETKAKWRRLMMRELVENWEQCVLQLPYYDIIGVNWRDMPPISHFSGNFWYASTRYVRSLADFAHYYDHPAYQIWDPINDKRLGCEFWIGSSREMPHVLSLVYRNVDFCNHDFWNNK